MSNSIFAIVILAVVFLSGCTTVVHPGRLTIGGGATLATNKTKPVCSWNQSDSRYQGTKQQAFSQTCTETYDLGDMRCTRTWTQSQASQNAPGKVNDAKSSYYSSSQPYCVPKAPAQPVTSTPTVKAPTPTPRNATCGNFEKVESLGLLARSCYIREELSDGRLSCLTGWDEEYSISGVLQKTGVDSAKRVCNPKSATAPTSAATPVAPPQQPRPNFGRKTPV